MIHNIPMNPKIFALLAKHEILPKSEAIGHDLKNIQKIVFHSNLQVSRVTRHFVQDRKTMIIGSVGYMTYAHSHVCFYRAGAFCSIASGVKMMGDNHPSERVSTHPVSYAPVYMRMLEDAGKHNPRIRSPYSGQQKPALLHHDVWIGNDVILAGGVTIGTGAIIAARAVVTKDVPPYAVVGGVPARIIKYRFSDAIRRRLLATRWWEYAIEDLADFSFDEPVAFCEEFERRKGDLTPRTPVFVRAADILALQ